MGSRSFGSNGAAALTCKRQGVMELLPLDVDKLRAQFNEARPFRWIRLSPFLREDFVREVARAYPTFDDSRAQGREFSGVNERRKVQITDSSRFPACVKRLADA